MTNEEAKVFLDNLKICIDEHPIVADWLVEIADLKTENSSEKPNNCEDLQDWKDRMWAEAIVTEPTCDTCRHKGVEGCEQPCLGCGCCGLYEAMTGNDKLKEKVVEFLKTCARCKHRPIGAMMCEESCHYEPQPTTQTETQNSNLTFEKDECTKEYEELGLKELKELIEADRKTEPTGYNLSPVEDEPQKDCKKCKNYDRCKNNRWKCCVYQPKDEPQTDCAWK